jgi:hypothetical protein
MPENISKNLESSEFLGYAGSGSVPKKFKRTLSTKDLIVSSSSELDAQILRLLALHPEVALEFRSPSELSTMDEKTKKLLLQDIQSILGIDPANHESGS